MGGVRIFKDAELAGSMTVNDLYELAVSLKNKGYGDWHIMFGDGYFPKKDSVSYYPRDGVVAIRPTAYDKYEIHNLLKTMDHINILARKLQDQLGSLELYPSKPKTNPQALYICDHKKCTICHNECNLTTDINHAVDMEELK